ncbi:hypothetical protein MHH60_26515 [Paenibacillus sp. FSL H7-0716]|uniref:DUF1640 domain-containing protein n=1 Tax=Paenibacillus odorifer TaxID=189426 RepID=A0AB36J743_9BACL|nr:hypothetical protein [Paenibacillus odorifer]OME08065.1 hypothetical protein BSK60_30735 [Paenibacillus odorifer]OME11231.1 hypothetical protein BSK47_29505 [Paenibacillus odorifer]
MGSLIDFKTLSQNKNNEANSHLITWNNNLNTQEHSSKGGDHMDESTKHLIDRIDRDLRDHKQEVRDRDARLQSEMQERENRYREDLLEQEKRFRQESKEREERFMSAIEGMRTDLKSDFKEVKDEVSSNVKHVQSLVRQNFWGNISAILAILGISATICFTVWAALNG